MKSIHDFEDSKFLSLHSMIRFPTKFNDLKILLSKILFSTVRKHGVAYSVYSSILGFTRHMIVSTRKGPLWQFSGIFNFLRI